jgi:hypothetical protein
MPEGRSHPRLPFGMKIVNTNSSEVGMIRDISLGGCFIHRSEKFDLLPVHSRVPLVIEIPGEDEHEAMQIEVEGKVMHHGKTGEGMGINFVMIAFSDTNVINSFVKAYE